MRAAHQVPKHLLAVGLDVHVGEPQRGQKGKLGRGGGQGAGGAAKVLAGVADVKVGKGDGLDLGAVPGDGGEVAGRDDALGGRLDAEVADALAARREKLLEASQLAIPGRIHEAHVVNVVIEGLEGGAEGGEALGDKELEGPQPGADVHDVGQLVAARVVDEVERLGPHVPVLILSSGSPVVVLYTCM